MDGAAGWPFINDDFQAISIGFDIFRLADTEIIQVKSGCNRRKRTKNRALFIKKIEKAERRGGFTALYFHLSDLTLLFGDGIH
jgi:hypothetical protein